MKQVRVMLRENAVSLCPCLSFTCISILNCIFFFPPEKGFTVKEPGLRKYDSHVGIDQELEIK